MSIRRHFWALCTALSVLLSGCQTPDSARKTSEATSVQESPPPSLQTQPSYGYALLAELMGDEKDVSKLLIIKRERIELKNLIKEISHRCGEAHKQLEAMAKSDPRLNLKNDGLPGAEMQARRAISKTKAKDLLTDKGKEFELMLLLSQNEALTYGGHLAKILTMAETSPDRIQFLQQLSADLLKLQQAVVNMLLANYQWQGK